MLRHSPTVNRLQINKVIKSALFLDLDFFSRRGREKKKPSDPGRNGFLENNGRIFIYFFLFFSIQHDYLRDDYRPVCTVHGGSP